MIITSIYIRSESTATLVSTKLETWKETKFSNDSKLMRNKIMSVGFLWLNFIKNTMTNKSKQTVDETRRIWWTVLYDVCCFINVSVLKLRHVESLQRSRPIMQIMQSYKKELKRMICVIDLECHVDVLRNVWKLANANLRQNHRIISNLRV